MNVGGGGAVKEGGCGGAELGGGGTSISPWRRSGTESILLFWRFVVLPTKRQHENNLRFIKKSQHIENIIYYYKKLTIPSQFCVVNSPVPFILGSLNGGRIGTLGIGTAKPCTFSEDWDLKRSICQQHHD